MLRKRIISLCSRLKILVQAGPGTGKTSILVSRVEYLLGPGGCQKILILSYSNAAVNELKQRLNVSNLGSSVQVTTIDSYVSREEDSGLFPVGRSNSNVGYSERIEAFLNNYGSNGSPSYWDTSIKRFQHILIDEYQDLVGIRLRFVSELLLRARELGLGYSVLGDPDQAIYGVGQDAELQGLFDKTYGRSDITCSYRFQDKQLQLMPYIINASTSNELISVLTQASEFSEASIRDFDNSSIGYLMPTNIGVARIGFRLLQEGRLVKKLSTSYENWPYNLPDYPISIASNDITNSEELIGFLPTSLQIELQGTNASIAELLESIGKASHHFLGRIETGIYVSTIHNVKGREFDVTVIDPSGVRDRNLIFVALTRARREFFRIPYSEMVYGDTNIVNIAWEENQRQLKRHYLTTVDAYEVLFEDAIDVDLVSYIKGVDAESRQSLLRRYQMELVGSDLIIEEIAGQYVLKIGSSQISELHGLVLATMSEAFVSSLEVFRLRHYKRFSGIKIVSVTPILQSWLLDQFPVSMLSRVDCPPNLRQARVWLGVKVIGMFKGVT